MKSFSSLLALSLPALALGFRSCPAASVYPSISGNITIDDGAYYAFRAASALHFSLPAVGGVGLYSSLAVTAGISPSSGNSCFDAIAARLTAGAGIPPVASIAWFQAQANYNIDINNSSINAGANAGVFSSALSTIFTQLIEYEDTNGNGVYDDGTDKKVSTKSLSNNIFNPFAWDIMCQSSSSSSPLVSFNITTATSKSTDFQFSIQSTLSNVVGVLNEGVIVTPRSMKIDLSINNYPYSGSNTKLALAAVVASAVANATVSASISASSVSSGAGDAALTFSWSSAATINGFNLGNAVATSGFSTFIDIASLNGAQSIFFSGGANAAVDFKTLYFSFAGVQPSSIYWDPSIASGPVIDAAASSSYDNKDSIALGLGLTFGLIGLGLVIYFAYRIRQRKVAETETESLVDHSSYARVNEL